MGLSVTKRALSHFGDSTGDWAKKKEEATPSQRMPPRQRNSKGTNVPPTASEPIGENEVASRQGGGIPLVEQEVVSEQRHARQEPDLMARMTAMLKDLEQEVRLLKEAGHRKSETIFPLLVTKMGHIQKEGQQWEEGPTLST